VVVSGLPRSGTSMVMGMLQAAGIETLSDGQRRADDDNPKGYFEDERVKALAREPDKSWVREARGKAVKVISYLLKDLPADNQYKVILLERDLDEVLASQAKMIERRGEADATGDEQMAAAFRKLMAQTDELLERSSHFESLRVRYSDVVGHPKVEAERINAFLGGTLDTNAMAAFVDPGLYRNRSG
jgi:hypothetical protein